jgi:glucitol/sorbitol PTS system EIIA component
MFLKTRITEIGTDVADLLEGGVLILFAEGAPPELAEVSVLHKVEIVDAKQPAPGSKILIGNVEAHVTAIGSYAWQKVIDIGHVVINFNNSSNAERPGEICATVLSSEDLMAQLKTGHIISISAV